MMLDAVQVDDDDMIGGVLPALERAFSIRFGRDLRHVRTAGDLFGEVVKHRAPGGDNVVSGSVMTFHRLRRALEPLWDEPRPQGSTPLRDHGLPSPRRLAALLERDTGLAMPSAATSMAGWLIAAALAVSAIAAFILEQPVIGSLLLFAGFVPLKLDGGEYGGEWETLGSLTNAVAALNFATLVDQGARGTEDDAWRAFTELLAPYAFVGRVPADASRIGPGTVLRFT